MRKGGLGLLRWAVPREPGRFLSGASPPPAGWWTCSGALQPIGAGVGTHSRPARALWLGESLCPPSAGGPWGPGQSGRPGGQGPLPALTAPASPLVFGGLGARSCPHSRVPPGVGGCPGRLAVSTELASASWGWLGELVPSTQSWLQRPVPQAVCLLLREPQKLLERWAWPGAIFLLQSPWEGSRAPVRTARLGQHGCALCPASEARTATGMGSWAPVLGSQSWWG